MAYYILATEKDVILTRFGFGRRGEPQAFSARDEAKAYTKDVKRFDSRFVKLRVIDEQALAEWRERNREHLEREAARFQEIRDKLKRQRDMK